MDRQTDRPTDWPTDRQLTPSQTPRFTPHTIQQPMAKMQAERGSGFFSSVIYFFISTEIENSPHKNQSFNMKTWMKVIVKEQWQKQNKKHKYEQTIQNRFSTRRTWNWWRNIILCRRKYLIDLTEPTYITQSHTSCLFAVVVIVVMVVILAFFPMEDKNWCKERSNNCFVFSERETTDQKKDQTIDLLFK